MELCSPNALARLAYTRRKPDENHTHRGLACRCGLARLLVPEDRDGHWNRRLVRIQRELRIEGAHWRHIEARRNADRPGPSAGRTHQRKPLRENAPGTGWPYPAGDRGDRERARRCKGKGARRARMRDARWPRAQSAPPLLVALRHLPTSPCRGDGPPAVS